MRGLASHTTARVKPLPKKFSTVGNCFVIIALQAVGGEDCYQIINSGDLFHFIAKCK